MSSVTVTTSWFLLGQHEHPLTVSITSLRPDGSTAMFELSREPCPFWLVAPLQRQRSSRRQSSRHKPSALYSYKPPQRCPGCAALKAATPNDRDFRMIPSSAKKLK